MRRYLSNIICIIAARGGSKRLPRKALQKIGNRTFIEIAIEAALDSKYIDKIVFSSDDKEMLDVANNYKNQGIVTDIRPDYLCNDEVELLEAIKYTANKFEGYDTIVILQIDHVLSMTTEKIDECIEAHMEYKSQDTLTIDVQNMHRTGAIRVLSRQGLMWGIPTARMNFIEDYTYYVDVHTPEDLEVAKTRMKWREYG